MCGITGIVYQNKLKKVDEVLLRKMTDSLTHRGPDSDGYYIKNNIGLGFRRLAIIDLSEQGNQPMSFNNYTIVFNGEIYNYKDIRRELIKDGYRFQTNSDTEVLIKAFDKYGIHILNKLNGMFSFSIYDNFKNKLFLCRDRAGKKPLHYYMDNDVFLFSSEIRAFHKFPNFNTSISSTGLLQYLTLGYIISPNSIYKNVYKVRPGHYLEIDLDYNTTEHLSQKCYWEANFTTVPFFKNNLLNLQSEFISLLSDSVSLRLNSDVPLSLFLSGGLDSSALATLAALNSTEEIHAFTIDFDSKELSEVETAKFLVDRYRNINHHILKITSNDIINDLSIIDSLDEPFSDSSIIPTYCVSRLVKEHGFSVALSGDGGDELLAGYFKGKNFQLYDNYYFFRINYLLKAFKQKLKKNSLSKKDSFYAELFERLSLNKFENYWYIRSLFLLIKYSNLFNDRFYNNLLATVDYNDVFPEEINIDQSTFNYFEKNDFDYRLADGYLHKVDRASMQNSLEVRNPFLDYRIIEFLSKIPQRLKFDKDITKIILRNTFADKMPEKIFEQKKMGFSIPLKKWCENDLKDQILNCINSSMIKEILNKKALDDLYVKQAQQTGNHNKYSEIIWRIFILSRFTINYKTKMNL